MLRLLIAVLVAVVALVRGGSPLNLARLPFRWPALILASIVIQLLIFTPWRSAPLIANFTAAIYIASMAILVVWVALNWRLPGMALMAAGLLLNLVAIVANSGAMPVWPEAANLTGQISQYSEVNGQLRIYNSVATDGPVQLWILTDIIPLPVGAGLGNVLSIGDLLLTIGSCILVYRGMLEHPAPEKQNTP